MRANKLQARVKKDHTVSLRLPEDVEEGPAEVIVPVSDAANRHAHSLGDFLARLPFRHCSKAEIDRYLEQEHQTWNQ